MGTFDIKTQINLIYILIELPLGLVELSIFQTQSVVLRGFYIIHLLKYSYCFHFSFFLILLTQRLISHYYILRVSVRKLHCLET